MAATGVYEPNVTKFFWDNPFKTCFMVHNIPEFQAGVSQKSLKTLASQNKVTSYGPLSQTQTADQG